MGKIFNRLEETFIALLMGVATVVIFISVLHRYGTGLAIPGVQDWLLDLNFGWAQEFCIILFVWMAKFGAAYGVRTGIHVGVDVLINQLSDKVRSKFILFGLLAGASFTATIGTLGAHFVWENGMAYSVLSAIGSDVGNLFEGPTTPDLEWPTWMVYSAIPLGSSLMCFRFLQVAVSFWRTGELPHHDHGHVDGIEDEHVPVDANPYNMDDDLHPRDLAHHQPSGQANKGAKP